MGTERILVVGGGVFGLSTAIELQKRGYTVTLIDRAPLPNPLAASTDISKVVRAEYGSDTVYMDMALKARQTWLELNARLGQTIYHDDGMILLGRQPMIEGSQDWHSYQNLIARGSPLQRLQGTAISDVIPALAPNYFVDGFFDPLAGWVESGRAIQLLAEQAQIAGVQIFESMPIQSLIIEGKRVLGVECEDGTRFTADETVLAVGSWVLTLLPELASLIKITGQMVFHLKPSQPDLFQPDHFKVFLDQTTGWYGFPLHPSERVVKIALHKPGHSIEVHPIHDARIVPPPFFEQRREFLREAIPALAEDEVVYSRCCLYCDTRDSDFLIDRHPNYAGLVVACGGSGHAFKFGLLLGQVIADRVEEKAHPYLSKFRWR